MSAVNGRSIHATTRICGVWGQPIRHSASPAMHNAAYAALGLDWCYVACEVAPAQLKEALEGLRAMHWVGANLTVPHKLLAVPLMDALDESAQLWGAVNTVVAEAEDEEGLWRPLGQIRAAHGPVRLRGYNTDADAVIRSIRDDLAIEPRGARVLLLGVGGAGRTAALRLADEGVGELWIVNRTESKAVELARELEERFPAVHIQVGYPDSDVEIVINATSLGLKSGDPLPFDPAQFSLQRAFTVYDMIYRPAETPFLKAARESGCRVANGLGMLLYQGAAALELWTGRPAPLEAMKLALLKEVYGAGA